MARIKTDNGLYGQFLLLVLAFCVLAALSNFVNEATQSHTIRSIEKVEATEGNSEGLHTRVYYYVYTDNGAYHIRTAGLNAAPECAGIQKDSTYTLVTRGINLPFFGVYPCIVRVQH